MAERCLVPLQNITSSFIDLLKDRKLDLVDQLLRELRCDDEGNVSKIDFVKRFMAAIRKTVKDSHAEAKIIEYIDTKLIASLSKGLKKEEKKYIAYLAKSPRSQKRANMESEKS